MSVTVLTVEQVAEHKQEWSDSYTFIGLLCDSHEALRAERDNALAEVARMRQSIMQAADQLKRHPAWDSHMSGTWTMLADIVSPLALITEADKQAVIDYHNPR